MVLGLVGRGRNVGEGEDEGVVKSVESSSERWDSQCHTNKVSGEEEEEELLVTLVASFLVE